MARTDPPDYGANDPTGYAAEPESEPIPRWRKPWALVGVGVLIAVLIGVIIYGLILLSGEDSTPTPATTTTTTTTTTATTTPTTTTTTGSGTPTTTTTTSSTGGFPHHLPSEITLPRTVITLPTRR